MSTVVARALNCAKSFESTGLDVYFRYPEEGTIQVISGKEQDDPDRNKRYFQNQVLQTFVENEPES